MAPTGVALRHPPVFHRPPLRTPLSSAVRLLGDDRPRTLVLAVALIIRFVRTGGVAMLRMMGGPPDTHEHDHSDSHASHGD